MSDVKRRKNGTFVKGQSGNPSGVHARNDAGEPAQVEQARGDGWGSLLHGIGDATVDKRMSAMRTTCRLGYQEIANLWDTDDVVAKAIEAPGAHAFSEGYEIQISDEGSYDDLKEQLEDKLEELGVDEKLERAYALSRAFGGSALLLGTDDPGTLQQPLDLTRVRSLDWINVLEPIELYPIALYEDAGRPNYGEPRYFQITTSSRTAAFLPGMKQEAPKLKPQTVIHASRLLVFPGIMASLYYSAASLNEVSTFWGSTVIHRFYDILRDHGIAYGAIGLLPIDIAQPVISIEGLKAMAAKEDSKALAARFRAIEKGRSVARAVLIDTKEKYDRQTTNLAGIDAILDRLDRRLAMGIDVPLSELIGFNPTTLGQSGEEERKQWNKKVRKVQRRKFNPHLKFIIKLLMRSLRQRKIPKKWGVEWNDLDHMTTAERAEAELTQARTDSMIIKAGMVSPDEVRRTRYKGGYSWRTQIDEKKKAPGFISPLPAGVLPGSMPAAGVVQATEAGVKAGAPAATGPGAHTVGGYARRNPTAPALGANPKQGGDQTPGTRGDADMPYTAEDELAYQRDTLARLQATGGSKAMQDLVAQVVAVAVQEAEACASGTCGPDCVYDHPMRGDHLDEFDIVEHLDRIEERDGKWVVLTEDRSEVLGTFDTEAQAVHRLGQIEGFKKAHAAARGA